VGEGCPVKSWFHPTLLAGVYKSGNPTADAPLGEPGIKKSLSQRVHQDVTGLPQHQRDLFSAFLSRYVNQDVLVLQDAQAEYLGLEPILLEAHQRYLTRKQVSASERRLSDSPSEGVSKEPLIADQIAESSKKSVEDVA
jgi:putative transposase